MEYDQEIEVANFCIRLGLLGEVKDSLRAVAFKVKKEPFTLVMDYYYDASEDADYEDDLRCVSSEATAVYQSFSEDHFICLDKTKSLPDGLKYAFLRKEENLPKFSRMDLNYNDFNGRNLLNAMGEALLGRVTSELTDVYGDIREDGSVLYLRFYHDKPISESTRKMWQEAIKETSRCFLKFPHKVDAKIIETTQVPKEFEKYPTLVCAFSKKEFF